MEERDFAKFDFRVDFVQIFLIAKLPGRLMESELQPGQGS